MFNQAEIRHVDCSIRGVGRSLTMGLQKTIQKAVTVNGVGLHSGVHASITLKPAAPNTGIVFVRSDIKNSPTIEALFRNVVKTQLATTIGKKGVTVSTVEHVMAAIQGFRIDNLVCEVSGPEVPIMDGSAITFVNAIESVGIESQVASQKVLVIKKKVEVKLAEKWAVALPSDTFSVQGSIDWDHPSIGFQEFTYVEGETDFKTLANARTFGFLRDVEALKKMGLARGGSLENAVVLDDALVLNPDGLRYPDEFARHKVLDALGDFKLAGISILGAIRVHRAGHDLHKLLLQEIFKYEENYEIVDSSTLQETSKSRKKTSLKPALARGYAASY